jgi:IgA Peptidase M64
MKKRYRRFILLLIFLMMPVLKSSAQKFNVDTLQYHGPSAHYINLVIVGDGYTATQLNKYALDARNFANHLFTQIPFKAYKSYFNVFAIQVISAESGVKHPGTALDCYSSFMPVSNPDNYLGTTFDGGGLHRLVIPNSNKVALVLAHNFPDYDQVVVLANTPYYGGSGGTYATATVNTASNDIAVHEIGHSFATLADEYWAGDVYARERANMTREADPGRVKWKNWLTPDTGVGIHAFLDKPWYKPSRAACKMEYLNQGFCAVCSETIIERIHALLNPVHTFAPDNRQPILTTPFTTPFYVSLQNIKPSPNTLKSVWQLNGQAVGGNTDSLLIAPQHLKPGLNNLSVSIIDTTSRTRSGKHQTDHQYTLNWTLDHSFVLPVTLTSFKAMAGAAGITLSWTTATEVNNDRFEIERSTNGLVWQVVGMVKGQGSGQSPQQYSFIDTGVPDHPPTLYYRLKQFDRNGLFEYSSMQAVQLKPLAAKIRLLGNPVAENLHFELSGLSTAPLTLDIYAPDGSTVLEWPLPGGQASRQITIPVARLAPGVYIYSLFQDTEVLDTGRFVKTTK